MGELAEINKDKDKETRILFVGRDVRFFDRIKDEANSNYPELEFEFQTLTFESNFAAQDLFCEINSSPVDIIYIDLTQDSVQGLYLAKLISRNNELHKVSMVGLLSVNGDASEQLLRNALNSGFKIIHYKSVEIFEVIYDPISLLDVDKAHTRELVVGKNMGEVEILQPLRVNYVEDNHFRIETNSYLKEGEIMEVDNHPLIEIMPSKKLYVDRFTGRDLYYNRRFSYDLEFIYIDNDFFSSSNKNWLIYKKLKSSQNLDSESVEDIDEAIREEVLSDMEKRKQAFSGIKQKIDKWIETYSPLSTPKVLKIMIFDHSLEIFKQMNCRIEDFPFSLNFQTKVVGDAYQIKRSTPHLIVFNFDERENSFEAFDTIMRKVKSLVDYSPAIVVSNFTHNKESLLKKYSYKNLIVFSEDIQLEEISKMASMLDSKKRLSVNSERVYPKSKDLHSFISMRRTISIVSASEIILYLKSDTKMPVFTVFEMKTPIKMLLTIVPFKEGELRPEGDDIYRALIHGISERERQILRVLINKSLKLDDADTTSG